jgi:hypothetical protein
MIDERWAKLLKRQEDKMELKKRKEDMSLLTASIAGMFRRYRSQNGVNSTPGARAGTSRHIYDNV